MKVPIHIWQLNANKSPPALNTLINEKFTKTNIALLQEPPLTKGSMLTVPYPLHYLTATANPRTAIIYNPSLDIWPIAHLSDRDCQMAIWYLNKKVTIILISAYWENGNNQIPPKLKKAIQYAKQNKYELFIGIDSNAHHSLWGSPVTNSRGIKFEELTSSFNLHILNNSNEPTYVKGQHKMHIDLTITSPKLATYITSWSNLQEDLLSDHKCLQTIISTNDFYYEPTTVLNYAKVNWLDFYNDLEKEATELSQVKITNTSELDQITSSLTQLIQTTLKNNAPSILLPYKPKKTTWWTEEVLQARHLLRTLYHKWQKNQELFMCQGTAKFDWLESSVAKACRALC